MDRPKVLEIMGHRVDLSRITNPALQRAIRDRIRHGEFLFAYGDTHSESHTDNTRHDQYIERYEDYRDYDDRKYREHSEERYEDEYNDNYRDGEYYSDRGTTHI